MIGLLGGPLSGCDCAGPGPGTDAGDGDGDAMAADAEGRDAGPAPDAPGGDPDSGGGVTCGFTTCDPGQRCEVVSGAPTCVDNECSDLSCSATERCEPHPDGGHVCVSIACTTDVQCDVSEYCDGTICVADVCVPGVIRCDGSDVRRCDSDGGGESSLGMCMTASYYATMCEEHMGGTGGCTCEDDWDCPAYTVCEVGTCVGNGTAPTCTLPPVPFDEALPAPEIEWGGLSRTDANARDGTGTGTLAPWYSFSHVLDTPIVANLDDDNGDGLINELDFPEILFVTHKGDNPWQNGVLRAIHGGGPNRGADFFARCGDRLWAEGDAVTDDCTASEPDIDAGAPVTVADIDGDGDPEIIAPTEDNRFRVLRADGTELLHLPATLSWADTTVGETIAIANLDYAGFAEIIVGRTVYMLDVDSAGTWFVARRLIGAGSAGRNDSQSQMACPADVRSDLAGMELLAGGTLYRLPDGLAACASPPCTSDALEVVYTTGFQGFCAIADVWGANAGTSPGPGNPLDGAPEVVLIDNGTLRIFAATDGSPILTRNLGGGNRGGAPNIDDFDGDGYMEIASALQNFYVVVDLQDSTGTGGACPSWPTTLARLSMSGGAHNPNPARNPGGACTMDSDCDAAAVCNRTLGECVCLHNGWQRDSDDDSSAMTSSSVFDFNGDGSAEVLYNDECDFRVYEGTTGEVLFTAMSRSRTGIENPVVADVDNDGNAEVVTVANTAVGNRCDEDGANPRGPNGIRVWGDPADSWVSARRVWNQQSYHVVNVTERGGIPAHAPESWGLFQGRRYNTYRSQPRNFGVAPDLQVAGVNVSSPGVGCGMLSDTILITFQIRNGGDLRVGPGVEVTFLGTWAGVEEPLLDGGGAPLAVTLSASLEPGRSVFLSVTYDRSASPHGTLPERVRVVVDGVSMSMPFGAERECDETNNDLDAPVDPGSLRPDLSVTIDTVTPRCPAREVDVATTVRNDGTAPASDIVVAYYAGDPSLGGAELHRETIVGPLDPGMSTSLVATIPMFPEDRDIRIYAVVDPDGTIAECNDANNTAMAPNSVRCSTGPI
ncbi:MAG: FG-GAP-like repeat-containing protein [Sandaracinaceae bacterium]